MVRLHLIRHGEAAAPWHVDPDPGLSEAGRAQAAVLVDRLARLGPLPLVASPLRRTRETAAPLERAWAGAARVEPAVAEVPSPHPDLAGRGLWLKDFLAARWSEQAAPLRRWRSGLVAALAAIAEESVVVTHYVVINAAVGAAIGDDRVQLFRPDYCSHTIVEAVDGRLSLVARGDERGSRVL
jgi:broad specificity phosphatase PhoE